VGVTKTNKCNINSLVATLIDNRKWGVTTDNDTIKAIIENYAVFLNCPTEDIDICYPDTCNNLPQHITCSIGVDITATLALPKVTFKAIITNPNSNYHTIQWDFDDYIFNLISNNNDTLVVEVKPNVDLATTTAGVSVLVEDEHGCLTTQHCYLVFGVMDCDHIPCSNTYDLQVT
jgi:hypothetical protein